MKTFAELERERWEKRQERVKWIKEVDNYIEKTFGVKVQYTEYSNYWGSSFPYLVVEGVRLDLYREYTYMGSSSIATIHKYKTKATIKKKVQEMIDNKCDLKID